MEHLEEYLKRFGHEEGFLVLDREEELELFFGYLPEGFIEDPYRDYILENLNTHSEKELQNQLQKHFKISKFQNMSVKGDKENVTFAFFIANKDYDEDELKHLLDFYGWYISKESDIKGGYLVAPKYSENKTKYIEDKCAGAVYHICKKEDLKDILNKGLRIKNTNPSLERRLKHEEVEPYRYFPERIYVIAAPDDEIVDVVSDVCDEMDWNIDERVILKIYSRGYFYSDDELDSENSFFTYTNIHKDCISKAWNLKDFLNERFKDSIYDKRKIKK